MFISIAFAADICILDKFRLVLDLIHVQKLHIYEEKVNYF